MSDPFQPTQEPARSLYAAFQSEAASSEQYACGSVDYGATWVYR